MKTKLVLLSSIAALALVGCQDNKEESETNEKEQSVEVQNDKEKINVQEEKEKETDEHPVHEVEIKNNQQEDKTVEENKTIQEEKEEHSHSEDNPLALKAEDIIVSYFNAISLGDSKTLDQLDPTAVSENEQLKKLYESSKVMAEIIKMEKVTMNDSQAKYKLDVKIYTKEEDNNFTNNTSTYTMLLDLKKGSIIEKEITATNYLE
ncbi:hypothetical protein MZM54_02385 [[Brevibacterium] frigoritolerans]|nr:hypothetical protein [Peribacillus frigoritolerans]